MNYIHNGDIKVHGNLKSKNCVVNSRWTVKLQDFEFKTIHQTKLLKRTVVNTTAPDYDGKLIML